MEGLDTLKELMILVNREREWGSGIAITAKEILDMVNHDEQKLQHILDYAKEVEPNSAVGENMGPDFVKELGQQWKSIGETQLYNLDYTAIRKYFQKKQGYSKLTPNQKKILESMHFEDDDFVQGETFFSEHDAVNMYNLREQLVAKLRSKGVLTNDVLEGIQRRDDGSFEGFEQWSEDFIEPPEARFVERGGLGDLEPIDFLKDLVESELTNNQFTDAELLASLRRKYPGQNIPEDLVNQYIGEIRQEKAPLDTFLKDLVQEELFQNPDYSDTKVVESLQQKYPRENISEADINNVLRGLREPGISNYELHLLRTILDEDDMHGLWELNQEAGDNKLSNEELISRLKEQGKSFSNEDGVLEQLKTLDSESLKGEIYYNLLPDQLSEDAIHELWDMNQDQHQLSNEDLIAGLEKQGRGFAGGRDVAISQLNSLDAELAEIEAEFGEEGPDLPPFGEPIEEKAAEVKGDTPGELNQDAAGDQPGLLGREEVIGGDTAGGGGPLADSELYVDKIDANRFGIREDMVADLTPADLDILTGLQGWVGTAAEGLSIPLKEVGKYIAKWGLQQLAAAPFFLALYAIIPTNADKWFNLSTGIMAALSGDPLGAIIAGTVGLVTEFNRIAARKEKNDKSYYGWKFGFTRHGKEWFPSFTGPVTRSTGFGDNTVDFQTIYGTGLYFQKDGSGVLRPFWSNLVGTKKFIRSDESVDDEEWGSWQYHAMNDGLSDFYFLTNEEQANLMQWMSDPDNNELKINGPAGNKFEKYEDKASDYNLKTYSPTDGSAEANQYFDNTLPAQESLLDLRWAMDYIQSFNFRLLPEGQRDVTLGQLPTIQRVREHSRWTSDPGWQNEKQMQYSTDPETYKTELQKGNYWNSSLNDTHLIEETLADEIETLWKVQRDAAVTHGFNFENTVGDYRDVDWRYYRDPTEFDYPQSSDDLQKQLNEIDAMEDRSTEDKAYLAQKSYTRYLISYVNQRGGTNDLYRYLFDSDGADTEMRAKGMLAIGDGGWDQAAGRRYIAPWMNDDESILPDFMTTLHTHYRENIDTWTYWMYYFQKKAEVWLQPLSYDYTPKPVEEVEEKKAFTITGNMSPAQLFSYNKRIAGETDDRPDWVKLDWNPKRQADDTVPGFRFDHTLGPHGMFVNDILGWQSASMQDYYHKWDEVEAGRVEWQKNFDNYWEASAWEPTDTSKDDKDAGVAGFEEDDEDEDNFLYYLTGQDRILSAEEQKKADDALSARNAAQLKTDNYFMAKVEEEIAAAQQAKLSAEQKVIDDTAAQKVIYDASAIHMDTIAQQTTTVTLPPTEETVHLTPFQEYLAEEHKSQFTTAEVTPEQFPWLSFGTRGPTLYGDTQLEERRGLPDYVKAIQTQQGVVHQAYMPELVTPGWGTMETSHAITAP